MLKKIFWIGVVWVAVIFTYIIMTAAMPAFLSIIETTNTTLTATSNMSNYPGLQDSIESAPLWLYLIPAGIGGIITVIILKRSEV